MKRLVIGILAHVDAGKTTLSEALLVAAGVLKKAGRVDHGDAFLDTDAQERARGITIFAKQAVLQTPQAEFTLLDTPGHVDFSPETERTLQVLDAAVLVVSANEGVQSHTKTLWQLLEAHRIPTFIFVNKMDLAGAEESRVLEVLRRNFGDGCIDFSAAPTVIAEQAALCDETLFTQFLEKAAVQENTLAAAVKNRRIFPCRFGSALKQEGVAPLLEDMARLCPAPPAGDAFAAQVYKISRDAQDVRLSHMKIIGGTLQVRDTLRGEDANGVWEEKVTGIRVYSGVKFESVQMAQPGQVCAVTGLTRTRAGEGLGAAANDGEATLGAALTYRVLLPEDWDANTALGCLRRVEEEEPQLHVLWDEHTGEIHVQLMGEVQLEVLCALLQERFHLAVTFGKGSIVYKETITEAVEGIGHFEPLRHYAEVHLLLEPAPRGSGLHFASAVSEDVLQKNWQRLVLTHLAEKTHRGVLTGAPITDMKITLVAGRAHLKHTEGGDFREATYRAVRQGLRSTKSMLLEPWYAFTLEVPAANVGRAMTDLQRMQAVFEPPVPQGEMTVLAGTAPVATMRDYHLELANYTHGAGRLACTLHGYAPCHNAAEVIAAAGYSADADVQNTADSVFCSHGAGTVVPWQDVPQHAHLASTLSAAADMDEPTLHRRATEYAAAMTADKELLAIFERTYGPVKQKPQQVSPVILYTATKAEKAPKVKPTGAEYLLVDGYNIIFAWEELTRLAAENLDSARRRLIDILCNYQGFTQCEVILVFDAYKVKGQQREIEKIHNLCVVYTKEAETADMYIERATHEMAKNHRVRVATSDGAVQMIILGNGALRVPATAFEAEVRRVEEAIRACL